MLNLQRNHRVGDWVLDRELGHGGQGVVWKARYAKSNHSPPAALKFCGSDDPTAIARFKREVELLRKQSHPAIIAVRDEGEHSGRPFFVMDLATTSMDGVLDGTSAGTRLLRESPALLLTLFAEACGAVAHLHEANILHRDLKPSNILLVLDPPEPMRALVADLGIAAQAQDQGLLTATLEVVGTAAYRAPETMLPGGHSQASDVYSLGKTLEAILTGRVPAQVGARPLPRHRGLTEGLWQKLDQVIARACQFEASARFPNAQEFLNALPSMVLASAGAPPGDPQVPAEVTLSDDAVAVLAEIIAACPGQNAGAALWSLENATRLEKYHFSMGLHELRDSGFLKPAEVEDQDGKWEGIRPTPEAYRWARNHRQEMRRIRSRPDDDIPF